MERLPNSTWPAPEEVGAALRARRIAAARAFDEAGLGDGLVLAAAGALIPIEGTDGHYPFRAHDDHAYLAGSRREAGVLLFDPTRADPWTLYVPQADLSERIWHGDTESLGDVAASTGLPAVLPLRALEAELGRHAGRPTALIAHYDMLQNPAAYELHPAIVEALGIDPDLSDRLEAATHAMRRVKDALELGYMRIAAAASAAGHRVGMRAARPGLTEIGLRIEIEAAFQRAGGEGVAYASIVAGGRQAAVLHATPSSRVLRAEDLVLIDAAAEVRGYDADITRTYPVSGVFSAEQAALYDIVLEVQKQAIAGAQVGMEYRDLHLQAARGVVCGLIDFGVLRGDPDELVERDAQSLFFPHGLGHLIGLATHDVGARLPGREPSERPGLCHLRADLPLEAGMTVTIEPGIYFIDALLSDPVQRETYADCVDFGRVERLMPLGGVRIEDDVLITAEGPEVLTREVVKEREAIEACCAG